MDITNSNSLKLTIQDLPSVIKVNLGREVNESILNDAFKALKEQVLYNSRYEDTEDESDIHCKLLNKIDDTGEIVYILIYLPKEFNKGE